MKVAIKSLLNRILTILLYSIVGAASIVFSVLLIESFTLGVVYKYSIIFTALIVGLISVLTTISISFFIIKNQLVYKISFSALVVFFISIIGLYILKSTGFLKNVQSVEKFRNYIASFKGYAVIIFILIQFLQVVILPIPSFITVGAGVLLFGAFYGAIYSVIGIVLGSIVAFLIGRVFGVKFTSWLIGKDNLKKGLKLIEGKDKVVLTFMFLFPFFPDDLLCFVSGITTIKTSFFIVMIVIVRIITVFLSSYSINGSIIPYNTWWGILIWALFFALTIFLTIIIYKNGDKIKLKNKNVSKNQVK